MIWNLYDISLERLGYLPQFLDEENLQTAKEQLHGNYIHGGGWREFNGFKLSADHKSISYPGDPPVKALGSTMLRDEEIVIFEYAWVAIIQPDGSYEIARMD